MIIRIIFWILITAFFLAAISGFLKKQSGSASPKSILKWFGVILTILAIGFIAYWIYQKATSEPEQPTVSPMVGQLSKLMFDGYTPCSPSIDYKFTLDTQGDSISLKFPGVENLVHYFGKGAIKVPPRKKGRVEIRSLNPTREARVVISKVLN